MATTLDTPTNSTPATDERVPTPGRLPYFPALDGVRGVSVIAVLLFHAGFDWMRGGFLGVSTFFTLSGFLITSLLLAERSSSGTVDLRSFWRRRVRRLMPASLLGIALALAYGFFAADGLQREQLAGDAVASLAYVANWWFLVSGQSYGEIFGDPSPLLHYWSLAIEEQFYLVFPLVAWLTMTRFGLRNAGRHNRAVDRRVRTRVTMVLATMLVATLAIPFVTSLSDDWLYFGTLARAPELLIGCLLAVALNQRRATSALADDRRVATAASVAGLLGAGGAVWLWTTTTESSSWLYQGGFAAYALISATIIVNALLPGSPVRAALSWRPLRWLGTISYGVYVIHWPIFLWLDESRTGLEGWPLFAVRLGATLVLAQLSLRLLEQPVRRGERLGRFRPAALAGPVIAGLASVAILLSVTAPAPELDFAAAQQELSAPLVSAAPAPTTTAPVGIDPATLPPPRPRIAAYGDSTAMMAAFGFGPDSAATDAYDYVGGIARLGCGLSRVDSYLWEFGDEPPHAHCRDWPITWGEHVSSAGVNVAYLQQGPWELFDRQIPGDPTIRGVGDPVYDEYLVGEMLEAIDVLTADGAVVAWATTPDPGGELENDHPERTALYNDIVRSMPALRPGKVFVVDLQAYVIEKEQTVDLRPDDVHFTADSAEVVVREFLGPAITAGFAQNWATGGGAQHYVDATGSFPPAPELPGPTEPLEVMVWGDETVRPLGETLGAWAGSSVRPLAVTTVATTDCGIIRTDARIDSGREIPMAAPCRDRAALMGAIEQNQPDVVVIVPGRGEIGEHFYLQEPWIDAEHSVFSDFLRAEVGTIADELRARDIAVVVAPTAPTRFSDGSEVPVDQRDVVIGVSREAAFAPRRAAWTRILELDDLASSRTDLRPDGATWSGPGMPDWVATTLGPKLIDLIDSIDPPPPSS